MSWFAIFYDGRAAFARENHSFLPAILLNIVGRKEASLLSQRFLR